MNDPELDALLGAYALDALEPAERARIDEYIGSNPTARHEVDELRESAASLALAPVDEIVAPPELWARISSAIAEEPRAFTPLPARRNLATRLGPVLAVAAAIAIVVLSAGLVVVSGRSSNTGNLAAAFDRAAKRTDTRTLALTQPGGATVARAVLLPDGTGYMKNDGMAPLPAGRTYQLWALTGDPAHPVAISAGVLGADPRTVAFHTTGDVHGFGVTVEQAPGVVSSHNEMYART